MNAAVVLLLVVATVQALPSISLQEKIRSLLAEVQHDQRDTVSPSYTDTTCLTTPGGKNYAGSLGYSQEGHACGVWHLDPAYENHESSFCRNNFCLAQVFEYGSGTWGGHVCFVPMCSDMGPNCKTTQAGTDYTGTMDLAANGERCLPWATQSTFTNFPDARPELATNYCRNPDGAAQPWCLTKNGPAECDIQYCEGTGPQEVTNCKTSAAGKEYLGNVSTTKSGHQCILWIAYSNPFISWDFPEGSADKAGSYCRNPNADILPVPWCIYRTPLGTISAEECDVADCN